MTDVVETEQTAEAPDLKVTDLQVAVQAIDLAASRGAYRGDELATVGYVRNRLAAFIEQVTPKEEAVAEAPTEEAASAAEEAPAEPKKSSRRKRSTAKK